MLGIAGILNQTADKILFPYIYEKGDAHAQLGIYGAASKIAMIMAMITQAFRYAYEPFVFGKAKDKDNRQTYASAMKYFVIFTLLAFLVVVGYLADSLGCREGRQIINLDAETTSMIPPQRKEGK